MSCIANYCRCSALRVSDKAVPIGLLNARLDIPIGLLVARLGRFRPVWKVPDVRSLGGLSLGPLWGE